MPIIGSTKTQTKGSSPGVFSRAGDERCGGGKRMRQLLLLLTVLNHFSCSCNRGSSSGGSSSGSFSPFPFRDGREDGLNCALWGGFRLADKIASQQQKRSLCVNERCRKNKHRVGHSQQVQVIDCPGYSKGRLLCIHTVCTTAACM